MPFGSVNSGGIFFRRVKFGRTGRNTIASLKPSERSRAPRPAREDARRARWQLMRAEIGGDLAAADEIAADHGAGQLVLDEQRQAPAEEPLDAAKQLKRRPGDLVLIGSGRLRLVGPLNFDMRDGDAESHSGIGDQVGSAHARPAERIEREQIVAMGEFEPLEGVRDRRQRRHVIAILEA